MVTRQTDPLTWRVRLRFRVHRRLRISSPELNIQVAGRSVVLSAPDQQTDIADSHWLILNARGIAAEDEAHEFGRALKSALELSSIASRIGVDTGRDNATSMLGDVVKEALAKDGVDVRNNVHGLDVFPDDVATRIFSVNATAVVHLAPQPFLSDLDELVRSAVAPSPKVGDVIRLLNYALMQPEPVAQIVFAVSAVEALGQDETWNDVQKAILRDLATAAEQSGAGTEAERQEVADAVSKSLHRLTLRQGVFRLLHRLNLQHLKKPWDALYAERSTLVHGLAPKPGADYGDLAHRTLNICGQILLRAAAAEIPQADRHVDRMYPT